MSKLTDSDGELQETEHWLFRAMEYGYIAQTDFDRLNEHCLSVGRMLGKMLNEPGLFLLAKRQEPTTARAKP